jgi:predicted transcriptional regulator
MKKTIASKTIVTVRLGTKERDELDSIARDLDRDRSYLISEAVRQYLDVRRWQIAHIEEGIRQADASEFATGAEIQKIFRAV